MSVGARLAADRLHTEEHDRALIHDHGVRVEGNALRARLAGAHAGAVAEHAKVGDRTKELVLVLAASGVAARGRRDEEEPVLEMTLARDLGLFRRVKRGLRDLRDLRAREVDLVIERRSADALLSSLRRAVNGYEIGSLQAAAANAGTRADDPWRRLARPLRPEDDRSRWSMSIPWIAMESSTDSTFGRSGNPPAVRSI